MLSIGRGCIYTDQMVNIQEFKHEIYINLFLSSTHNFLTSWPRSHVFWSDFFLLTWSRYRPDSIFKNVDESCSTSTVCVSECSSRTVTGKACANSCRNMFEFLRTFSLDSTSESTIACTSTTILPSRAKLQVTSSSRNLGQFELVNLVFNFRIKLISLMEGGVYFWFPGLQQSRYFILHLPALLRWDRSIAM